MKSSEAPSPSRHWTGSPCRVLALLLALGSSGTFALPAAADDSARAQAEASLKGLDAEAKDKELVAPLVARARKALERALGARRSGDHAHGSQLEALALELTDAAKDLVRTHAAEVAAKSTEDKALDLETRVVRARALVEQAAARRGRASERLRGIEAERGKPAPATSKTKKVPAATDPATAAPPVKVPVGGSKP
ncbi:MAG TPA: hypothetical protein VFQ35_13950 [Polyangiaceae bacterium]|nr:hypothetical protein [Polyangiaceae bacterium]